MALAAQLLLVSLTGVGVLWGLIPAFRQIWRLSQMML